MDREDAVCPELSAAARREEIAENHGWVEVRSHARDPDREVLRRPPRGPVADPDQPPRRSGLLRRGDDLGARPPTEQIQHIIAAARAGKNVLELTVYDGSDNGERVYNTLSVIGQPIPGDRSPASPDASTASDAMKAMTRWPVTVSYYDREAKAKDGDTLRRAK